MVQWSRSPVCAPWTVVSSGQWRGFSVGTCRLHASTMQDSMSRSRREPRGVIFRGGRQDMPTHPPQPLPSVLYLPVYLPLSCIYLYTYLCPILTSSSSTILSPFCVFFFPISPLSTNVLESFTENTRVYKQNMNTKIKHQTSGLGRP